MFASAFGARISALVKDGVSHARLHLNPAAMGPIAVQISVEGSQARVELVAEQPMTRQVLEQAMPVLASALRDNGLTLAGGGVFDQAREPRQADDGARKGRSGPGPQRAQGDAVGVAAAPASRARRGLLDLYA